MGTANSGLGIGYSFLGVLATCASFQAFGGASLDSMLPAMLYLGVVVAGLGVLMGKRPSQGRIFHASLWRGPKAAQVPALPRTIEGADAAVLGHEIKNYLCTLKGNARLLRQRGASADHSRILDRIDHVVEKMEVFVKELGSVSATIGQPSGAPPALKPSVRTPVRLDEVARACVRNHFHAKLDGFRFEIRDESSGLIGDPDRLEQIFLNLYVNAGEAGALQVETRIQREGQRLVVQIEDDGMGCHPEDLGRIFEPFFSTKAGPARRGLGMFIVQSIVESHGGKITVHSKNNPNLGAHGLIFTIDFPLYKPAALQAPAMVPALAGVVEARRRAMALPEPI